MSVMQLLYVITLSYGCLQLASRLLPWHEAYVNRVVRKYIKAL
jgi:hypothetical protein